jgi:hypothetical protein
MKFHIHLFKKAEIRQHRQLKNSFYSIAIILCFFASSEIFAEWEPAEVGSYQAYKESIQNICYATDNPAISWNNKSTFGSRDLPETLLSISRNDYPDMFSGNYNKEFEQGIKSVKWNSEDLAALIDSEVENLPLASQIEKSSLLYKERMNAVFGCAVLNTRLRIHKKLSQDFKPSGSNIIRRLEETSGQIEARMKERSCRNVALSWEEGADISLMPALVRSATLEYCNYRYYLGYVDHTVKNRLWNVIQAEEKMRAWWETADPKAIVQRFPSVENAANAIVQASERTQNEIARTRIVYDEAFDAYREFEKNYASHVLLVLIEDRYLLLREYLRDTMNPIGQVIYKASNATSTGN